VLETKRSQVWGAPDSDHISTAYVERNNLTMRMSMRRFMRLTNAFRRSSRIFNGRTWTLYDLANLPDVMRDSAAA